jgi:PmbA protein
VARAASGWRAARSFPVEEVTIAGNLSDMFKGIVAIGPRRPGARFPPIGSILIDRMTIAVTELR